MAVAELQKTCSRAAHSASVQTKTTTAAPGRVSAGVLSRVGAWAPAAPQLTGGNAGVCVICRVAENSDSPGDDAADSRAGMLLLPGCVDFMVDRHAN